MPIGWVAGGLTSGCAGGRLAERPPGHQQDGAEPEQAGDRAQEGDDRQDLQRDQADHGREVRPFTALRVVAIDQPLADPDAGHEIARISRGRPRDQEDGQAERRTDDRDHREDRDDRDDHETGQPGEERLPRLAADQGFGRPHLACTQGGQSQPGDDRHQDQSKKEQPDGRHERGTRRDQVLIETGHRTADRGGRVGRHGRVECADVAADDGRGIDRERAAGHEDRLQPGVFEDRLAVDHDQRSDVATDRRRAVRHDDRVSRVAGGDGHVAVEGHQDPARLIEGRVSGEDRRREHAERQARGCENEDETAHHTPPVNATVCPKSSVSARRRPVIGHVARSRRPIGRCTIAGQPNIASGERLVR